MPETTPLIKVAATKAYGAQVVLSGTVFEDAYQEARRLESEKGYVFVHAFDDDAIIAGQGTAALEILEQVPDVDVLIASVGGGGFLGGMALVMKSLKPSVRVIGVEATTVAERGFPSTSAISPKKSPRCTEAIRSPSCSTDADPSDDRPRPVAVAESLAALVLRDDHNPVG